MNYKLLLTLTLLILTPTTLAIETVNEFGDYEITSSYFDAEEDETFTLTVTIKNTDSDPKIDVIFDLDDKNPLSVDNENTWIIGVIPADGEVENTFRIEVDEGTEEGEYELEFNLKDSKDDFDDEIEIEVISDNADLKIGEVKSFPSSITPDLEDIKIEVTVDNLGGGDATFVNGKLILPRGFETSSSFSDHVSIGVIGAKNSQTFTFFIDTNENLKSGNKNAKLEMTFRSNNKNRKTTQSFDLPVKGSPLFEIIATTTNPNKLKQGDLGKLNIKIKNIGEEEGKETSVRVFENVDLPIEFDEKTNFIGNIELNEEATASFNLETDSDANPITYFIKVQVRTISNENVLVSQYSIPITIGESEGTSPLIFLFIAILVILLVILILLLRKRR